MKIQSMKMGVACALVFAALWVVCSFLVWLSPASMAAVSSHMLHLDVTHFSFTLTLTGILIGLVSWSLVAGLAGLLIAATYNLIAGSEH